MKYTFLLFFFAILITPLAASAGEIHYGHILEQHDGAVYLEYKGPGDEHYYRCTTSGACSDLGTTSPAILPALAGETTYPKNAQGTYGVRTYMLGTTPFYILYDLRGTAPKPAGTIPYPHTGASIHFSPDGEHIVFIRGATAQRYSIAQKSFSSSVALPQSSLPFRALSYSGTYLSMYNYLDPGHRIVDLTTGKETRIKSSAPSYVEFSEDERVVAFADTYGDYKTLYSAPIQNPIARVQITSVSSVAEDYLYVGNTLFYLTNDTNPLLWSLYRSTNGGKELVEAQVSYGDYLSRVEGQLAYLKVEGKNTDVVLYHPQTREKTLLNPAPRSPARNDIEREIRTVANRTGVLLSPKESASDTLVVWLHGGPRRQVSLAYHPYLSYAVYDELLENIVGAGSYVYKLDYTGSDGYGNTFAEALHKKIGITDREDVVAAAEALSRELGVSKVYLIGNSYGGYLSLKTLADSPSTIDGAVSINGVTDWYGLISRIPSSIFAPLFEGAPESDNIPAYFAAEVFSGLKNDVGNQPILIVYGDEDKTVPHDQSLHYLTFARDNNKNIAELKLEGEEHIIRERASLTKLCEGVKNTFSLARLSCGK